jgi:hypothetical protein
MRRSVTGDSQEEARSGYDFGSKSPEFIDFGGSSAAADGAFKIDTMSGDSAVHVRNFTLPPQPENGRVCIDFTFV